MVKRNSYAPSPTRVDREWPYQVALPDDLCVAHNFNLIMAFFHENAVPHVVRQVQAIWPSGNTKTSACIVSSAWRLPRPFTAGSAAICSTLNEIARMVGLRVSGIGTANIFIVSTWACSASRSF